MIKEPRPVKGPFLIDAAGLKRLTKHIDAVTTTIMEYIDDDGRLVPSDDSNWPMLNNQAIELFMLADRFSFGEIARKMLATMDRECDFTNPFLVTAKARLGDKDEGFRRAICQLVSERHATGLIYFNSGYLKLGDHFSTLWSLLIIALAGEIAEYKEVVFSAVNALESDLGFLAGRSAQFVGFFAYVISLLNLPQNTEPITKAVNHILEDKSWKREPLNGAFVVFDLLSLPERNIAFIPEVEEWLRYCFNLNHPVEGSPEPLQRPTDPRELDYWFQTYIRSAIAALLYVRMRTPEYRGPVPSLVARVNRVSRELAQTKSRLDQTEERLHNNPQTNSTLGGTNSDSESLEKFWEEGAYERSVFIMKWMEEHSTMTAIAKAVKYELEKQNLIPRYVGDRPHPYLPELWANTALYMRGCKYGIALIERLQRKGGIPLSPNRSVLIEFGFVCGAGGEVLILYDLDSMKQGQGSTDRVDDDIGLPYLLSGVIREDFSSQDPELTSLHRATEKWARGIRTRINSHLPDSDDQGSGDGDD